MPKPSLNRPGIVRACALDLAESVLEGVEARLETVIVVGVEILMIPVGRWADRATAVNQITPEIIPVKVRVATNRGVCPEDHVARREITNTGNDPSCSLGVVCRYRQGVDPGAQRCSVIVSGAPVVAG